jgi:hypothetical protein
MAFYGNGSNITNIPEPAELSTASGSAPSYSVRAWAHFDQSSGLNVNASANVSSISDNGTGDFTVNFSTALPPNYAIGGGCAGSDYGGWYSILNSVGSASVLQTGSARLGARNFSNNSLTDNDEVHVIFVR